MESKRVKEKVAKLSLEEKVALLTGRDFWHTVGNEKIALRPMRLSDGPSGVRGKDWDARFHSLNLPSGSALAGSWSTTVAKKYGEILGREAKRKGADVVLGPTINLHRSPFGGRHFECLSEDPYLTSQISVAYIIALQSHGVAACPKHYICNDSETDRMTVDVVVDDKTLNEVYLRPFEDAITVAKAWSIMSSYNSLNGKTVTENEILNDPLKSKWGFDGVVISDWTAVRSLESAKQAQDLVMPGPVGPWGDALVEAVKAGEIAETVIDDKVERLLLLAMRTGALDAESDTPKEVISQPTSKDLMEVRDIASMCSVLLKNDGILPLQKESLGTIGLFGHNADLIRTQGGGSATVFPTHAVSILEAMKGQFADKVRYAMGAQVFSGIQEFPRGQIVNPTTGENGVDVKLYDELGNCISQDSPISSQITWIGASVPLHLAKSMTITTVFTPQQDMTVPVGFATMCKSVMKIDGAVHLTAKPETISNEPFQNLIDPPHASAIFTFKKGNSYKIEVEVDLSNRSGMELFAMTYTLGLVIDELDHRSELDHAVAVAKKCDVSIVVVGTNSKVESEGFDRDSLSLPGRQDELVEAIAAVSEKTIVIVNAGSPVLMPWRDKVDAILLTFFGGQESGNSTVDILLGDAEPGGRLPTTWPIQESDLPVHDVRPTDGKLIYSEGANIGYRAWLKANKKPAYEFGFGLGYTSWSLDASVHQFEINDKKIHSKVKVTNTGKRRGRIVIQAYAESLETKGDRPRRWLVGWSDKYIESGAEDFLEISIEEKEFRFWDEGWKAGKGRFKILLGLSALDIFHESELIIP